MNEQRMKKKMGEDLVENMNKQRLKYKNKQKSNTDLVTNMTEDGIKIKGVKS